MQNKTFAIIKPDAIENKYTGKIIDRILPTLVKNSLFFPLILILIFSSDKLISILFLLIFEIFGCKMSSI